MKRVLVFLGLKVVEIGVIILFLKGYVWILNTEIVFVVIIAGIVAVVLFGFMVWGLIMSNWEWAGQIVRRKK